MQPIFNEFIQFLSHNKININLCEGYYWWDSNIIKAYDIYGQIHNVARVSFDEKQNMSYEMYPMKDFKIASWYDMANRNADIVKKRWQESLRIIRKSINDNQESEPIIMYSSGKDSEVILHIAQREFPDIKSMYFNPSMDSPDSYRKVKSMDNIEIINPKVGFYKFIEDAKFIPSMNARLCCSKFKEDVTALQLDKNSKYTFFFGMRNKESNKRSNYKDEWNNKKWGKRDWKGFLPIRKWSDEEVWYYIFLYNVAFNDKYRKGYSRAGCTVVCPYSSVLNFKLDEYWYSEMYNRWQRIIKRHFINGNKWTIFNCTLEEYGHWWSRGVYRDTPTTEVIEEFARYNDLDIDIAKQYFCKKCDICEDRIVKKDVVGMNLKYHGRNINKFYCKKHLMEQLNITKDQWEENLEDFKSNDCKLI